MRLYLLETAVKSSSNLIESSVVGRKQATIGGRSDRKSLEAVKRDGQGGDFRDFQLPAIQRSEYRRTPTETLHCMYTFSVMYGY